MVTNIRLQLERHASADGLMLGKPDLRIFADTLRFAEQKLKAEEDRVDLHEPLLLRCLRLNFAEQLGQHCCDPLWILRCDGYLEPMSRLIS
jgi:hypothetical protein